MSFDCDKCNEPCGDHEYGGDAHDATYCKYCWPQVQQRIESEQKRNKRLGHTGDDLCGCPMCAERFEAQA